MASQNTTLGYHLNRDSLSSARLNLQHYNFINQFGWHVHPSIPLSLGTTPGSLIADIGTGTGLWAIEVANQRPGSTIVGLDVDLVQTPPKEWLPPNVQMHKLDLLADDVPPEWEGAFNIVHIRHFVVVTPDIRKVTCNIIKLIKPGGYLQWTEFDLSRARIYKANDSLKSSALERIIFPYDTAKPVHLRTRQTWVSELRGVLEEQGLETVVEERRRPSPYYRNVSLETSFMSYLEMSCKSADPAQGEALRKMISEAEEEVLGQGEGSQCYNGLVDARGYKAYC